MVGAWKEVTQADQEKRCELVLTGTEISKRIDEGGLDNRIFALSHLNFLEITLTSMKTVPDEIGSLINLTRLVLRRNEINHLSENICYLKKLKFFDISFNQLEHLPDKLNQLTDLQSLNVSGNCLTEIPNLKGMAFLASLSFAQNAITGFPDTICDETLVHLAEVVGGKNEIDTISPSIKNLQALKNLDLSNNKIKGIPGELGNCLKIKELDLKENPIQDNRLKKLVNQCHVKQVLEYIRTHCPKESTNAQSGKNKGKAKGGKKQKNTDAQKEPVDELTDLLRVFHVKDEAPVVIIQKSILEVRPHIVCCIVRNVDLKESFKQFISLQTKLHEGICEKRSSATIATHDLKAISGNLTYLARPPKEIKLVPLGKLKEVTADELYKELNNEAEALRKEKKKNTYSGIHKYLYLLKNQTHYPCLMDSSGQVISFPPITNCNSTKISMETTDLFLEVTGTSLPVCKKVMDSLLYEMLKLGLGKNESTGDTSGEDGSEPPGEKKYLTVDQIRIVDEEWQLRSVYPARNDLPFTDITVLRD